MTELRVKQQVVDRVRDPIKQVIIKHKLSGTAIEVRKKVKSRIIPRVVFDIWDPIWHEVRTSL